MNADTTSLLINAGIAGVFAVFAIALFKEFTKYLDRQDNKWMAFLDSHKTVDREILKEITSEIKSIAVEVAHVKLSLSNHDLRVVSAIPIMADAIKTIVNTIKKENTDKTDKES